MRQFYYKMRELIQNATFITNCDSTLVSGREVSRFLIHSGANDIANKANTLQKIRKAISAIKGHDAKRIYFLISSVIYRGDQNFEDLNRNLENFCKGKYVRFISNNNNDDVCLNRSCYIKKMEPLF